MLEIANHFMNDEQSKVRLAFLPKLCDFVALFSESHQQVLLHTLIKERLLALEDFSSYNFTGKNKKTELSEV